MNTVPTTIPVTSTMPMLFRAAEPGPVASTRGKWPNTVAAEVMSTGRSRVSEASRIAASLACPSSCSRLANSTIRMPFFAIRPTRVISPTCE